MNINEVIFHEYGCFKKGVQAVPTENGVIYYINPEDFPVDEVDFGMAGVELSRVTSRTYISGDVVKFFASRLRTVHSLPDIRDAELCMYKEGDDYVCRIERDRHSFNRGLRTWAQKMMDKAFPVEVD